MTPLRLYRIAGIALLLGGALVAASELVEPTQDARTAITSAWYYPSAWGILLGGLLFIASWPATYLRQRGETDALGFAGMLLVLVAGALVTMSIALIRLIMTPWVVTLPANDAAIAAGPPAFDIFFPIVGILAAAGGILYGIATWRARVYPRALAVGFLVIVALFLVLNFVNLPGLLGNLSLVAYMIGLAWYGLALYRSEASGESPQT